MILCFSSGGINITLSISSSCVCELLFGEVFTTYVILIATLLPIISPVSSAIFRIALFEVVLSASLAIFVARSEVSDYIYH